MIIIAAMSADRLIGSGSGMPWSVPEEYAQFLDFIRDQTVIMGRRSWEIFGADLTSAHNIVITRSEAIDGTDVAHNLLQAVEMAKAHGTKVFCAGGGSIYAEAIELASEMFLSIIKGKFAGDTYFPEFDDGDWEITERRDHDEFEFVAYSRRSKEAD